MLEFVVAEKESLGSIPKCLCVVCGSVTIDRHAIDSWVKVTVFQAGSAEVFVLPH
jgi:hypothetical protein